jgi:hypothetical protein
VRVRFGVEGTEGAIVEEGCLQSLISDDEIHLQR